LNFKEYQDVAWLTAVYPRKGNNYVYPALKLAGEAGEVAEKFGKIIRDQEGVICGENRTAIAKELGDVLWYVAALCTELDLDMDQVAQWNIKKLQSRQERGKLKGSGDER
jgi:NTP pyrophosphatase (non-canonical NTP hydrolase)